MSPSIPPSLIFTTRTRFHTKNPSVESNVSTHPIIHILENPPQKVQSITIDEEVFSQQNGRIIHDSTSNSPSPSHTQVATLEHVDPLSIPASITTTPLMNIVLQVLQVPDC
jgi:hypothetical protein